MKKCLSILLSVLMLIGLLTACGSGSAAPSSAGKPDTESSAASAASSEEAQPQPAPENEQTVEVDPERKVTVPGAGQDRYEKIVVGLSSDTTELTPQRPNAESRPYFYSEIYEYLFDIVDLDYVPALAKSYEVVDPLHWNVTLRDGIYDSSGNSIDADDVVYSFDWLVNNGTLTQMDIYGGIEKIDDMTVQFTWNIEPETVLALEGPFCRVCIFDKDSFENGNFATNPVATGPYVVKEFVPGARIVLEANDNYWGFASPDFDELTPAHHANVQTIEYQIKTENAQHTIGLQTGGLDFSEAVPADTLYNFEEGGEYAEGLSVSTTLSNLILTLGVNCSADVVTSDPELRIAMYYALDNETLAAIAGDLEPLKALGSRYFADYVEDWENLSNYMSEYDLAKSKEHLDKSSYNGETIRIYCTTDETTKNIATMVEVMLEAAGIDAEVKASDETLFSTVQADSAGWEVKLQVKGGGLLSGLYNSLFNAHSRFREFAKQYPDSITTTFIEDPHLTELYAAAISVKTYSDESMTELMQYAIDNGYAYFIGAQIKHTVMTDDIASLYYREGCATMGGSIFYLD